jgi:hypothetical protein
MDPGVYGFYEPDKGNESVLKANITCHHQKF